MSRKFFSPPERTVEFVKDIERSLSFSEKITPIGNISSEHLLRAWPE